MCFCVFQLSLSAQQFWQESSLANAIESEWDYRILKTYRLDSRNFLSEFSYDRTAYVITTLPFKNGQLKEVELQPYQVFSDELAAKYPAIKSYKGSFKDSRDWTIYVSVSPYYINVTYRSVAGDFLYIDPISLDSASDYILYEVENTARRHFTCSAMDDHYKMTEGNRNSLGDCKLRKYRLALSCTAEYANYHGGTIEKVLTAYNNSVARINSVYETDLGIKLILINNVDKLIFFNANSDPFSNNNSEAMLDENQDIVDQIIGKANYDIGHVFSTGDGGIASIRSVCTGSKAQGVTGNPTPKGDAFDIDYVCHEMGHQFGGNHTQNNSCQRSSSSSYEPGSASTIMGYAGICDPNVQNNSHAYFHNHSLNEIFNFIVAGNGKTCGVVEETLNNSPDVTVAKSLYVIPKSTSFFLEAQATDPDGDLLTYCWEQFDREVGTMPPTSANISGPMFRSILPSISPIRYFPDLQKKYGQWEVLPSVGRTLNFKCTVRDNSQFGGCIDEESVSIIVNGATGPFVVTYPSTTGVSWQVGSAQTITWNVANTDLDPIKCAKVDVLLSLDGGKTYPHIIATGIPNNGSTSIITPNFPTTTARIMVKSANNIFYDVSDFSFKIISTFSISTPSEDLVVCQEDAVSFLVNVQGQSNSAPSQVSVNLINLPDEIIADLPSDSVAVPGEIMINLSNLSALLPGIYTFQVNVMAGVESYKLDIIILKGVQFASPLKTNTPINGTSVSNNVTFEWDDVSGIQNYTFEISKTNDFSNADVIENPTNSLRMSLDNDNVYLWRVKGNSPCIDMPFNDPQYLFVTTDTSSAIIINKNQIYVENGSRYTLSKNDILLTDSLGNSKFFVQRTPSQSSLLNVNTVLVKYDTFHYEDIFNGNIEVFSSAPAGTVDTITLHLLDQNNRWKSHIDLIVNIVSNDLIHYGYRMLEPILCAEDSLAKVEILRFGDASTNMIIDNKDTLSSQIIWLESGQHNVSLLDENFQEVHNFYISIDRPTPIQLDVSQEFYNVLAQTSGGTGEVFIKVNDGIFEQAMFFEDLPNGHYIFTAQDELGCSIQTELDIVIQPLTLQISYDSIMCYNEKTTISVIPAGGFAPYEYALNLLDFQADSTFNLGVGTYKFSVQDKGGLIVTLDSILITAPKQILASTSVNRYDAILNVTGGTPPYAFSVNDTTYQSNETLTFNANGNYKVYIKDSNGCKITKNISINVFNTVNPTIKHVSCFGENDGNIRFVFQNGSAPYMIKFNNSDYTSNRIYSNLVAGIYPYKIYDAKNDTVSGNITITEPLELSLDVLLESSGFTLQGKGGVTPYMYSIDSGFVFVESNQFKSLPDGTYFTAVKDANGCVLTQPVFVTDVIDFLGEPITVFPNPTFGRCYIKGLTASLGKVNIDIFSLEGRLIEGDIQLDEKDNTINLTTYPKGIYLIKINNYINTIVIKVVKV